MNLPKRKPNRLNNYNYNTNGCYFVTLCTQNRKRLFEIENVGNNLRVVSQLQNQIIHKWVKETENKYGNVKFDKYVILPDHLHFIINFSEQHAGCSLPNVMRFFKTMTTNEYIRCVKSNNLVPFDKKLWQKSYYDHIIRNQNDYNEVWQYIDNNPTNWVLKNQSPQNTKI